MKIAMMAPLWKEVPPTKYGGSELVVSLLTESLVELGHEVTLFACGGSQTRAKLVEILDQPMFDAIGGKFVFDAIEPYDLVAIKRVFAAANKGEFDIIHNHMGMHVPLFSSFTSVPVVTTNHSSVAPDFPVLQQETRQENYVSISNAQRSLAPNLNYVATVYHGIATEQYQLNETPEDYLAYLATMWNEKGVDRAIEIAKRTGSKLVMAGDIRRQEDFDAIKDEIDGVNIQYLGEIDVKQKTALLSNAKALLFPIRWAEAFGLVVPESLACGTPVIAYPEGAMPELIDQNITGRLVSSIDEACRAVNEIGDISRRECRKQAVEKFDRMVMAENYLKVYGGLIK